MVTLTFDTIIIGTGQAGPSLAARLASEGKQVAIIASPQFKGTDIINDRAYANELLASARVAHSAKRADDFGVSISGDIKVDMQQVQSRLTKISKAANESGEEWLNNLDGVTVIRRHARFEANDTIRCGEQLLQAEQIFINVGSSSIVPVMFADIGAMTCIDLVELAQLPEHLIVVGGSDLGLEFAQIFRRLGSEVTIVERATRILAHEDENVSQSIQETLAADGIRMCTGAECIASERSNERITVHIACGDHREHLEGSHLLLAMGRQPNTKDLGLHNTDVVVNKHGYLKVDSELQTAAEGVWAIGECNGREAFPFSAWTHREIATDRLPEDDLQKIGDHHLAYGHFIDPPLGRVGMDKQAARASGRNVLIGHLQLADIHRATARGEAHGFIEVLADSESEQLLGATVHGTDSREIVQLLVNMMYAGVSYRVIAESAPLHPTATDLLPRILESLRPLA